MRADCRLDACSGPPRRRSCRHFETLIRNTQPPAHEAGGGPSENPVLMALLLTFWRWLTAPAEGIESPPARSPRVHPATAPVARQRHRHGGPFLATIHAPPLRLLR